MRYTLISILLLAFNLTLLSQETSVNYLKDNKFKEAQLLLEQEQYLPAKKLFEDFLSEKSNLGIEEYTYWQARAKYYLAWLSLQLDEPKAEKELIQIYENYQGTQEARLAAFNLGQFYYRKRRYKNVIRWFEKVDTRDLDKDEVIEFKFKSAYSYFILKRFDSAKPLLTEIKDADSKYTFAANYYYGFIEFYEGRYNTALEAFNIAERSEIFEDIIPYYKAQIFFFNEEYGKVITYLDPFLGKEDVQYKKHLHHLIGKAYFKLEDYRKAAENLRIYADNSRRLDDKDIYQLGLAYYSYEDYQNATLFLEELIDDTKDSLGQYAMYTLADVYILTGYKEKAWNALNSILANEENELIHQLTLINYATLSHELNYQKEAYTSILELKEKYPKSSYIEQADKLLVDVLFASNNYKEAIDLLEKMKSLNADMKEAYQKIAYKEAVGLKNDNRIEASLSYVEKSLQYPLDPKVTALSYFLSGELNYLNKKYSKSIDQFLKFNQTSLYSDDRLKFQSSYTTAYAYMKMKQYKQAVSYFDKVISTRSDDNETFRKMLYDAYIRKGDCHLMSREFSSAVSAYKTVVDNKWNSWDYAMYQQALVEGIKGNTNEKINLLLKLNSEAPKSLYADDALFFAASSQSDNGSFQSAIANFDRLISEYSSSKWVPESYMKKGLLNYNTGNTESSINNFKHVIENYPNSVHSRESMKSLKEIYVSLGKTQDYIDYINSVPNLNLASGTQDSLLYSTAEEFYYKADCDKAVSYFSDYLQKFPKGIFHLRARYFRASCYMKLEDFMKALSDYEYISAQPLSEFTETSLLRASELNYYEFKDYSKSFDYYKQLFSKANTQDNKDLALRGLMRSSYRLDNFDDCIKYADQVLLNKSGNFSEIAETNYYLGKIYYKKGKFTVALSHFQAASDFKNSSIGAESQYHIARIEYLQKDYTTSLEECFETKNEFSNYDYWVVKAFILMADNYVELDNEFQAKATLQSIVDNYTGDKQLLDEAKRKLAQINESGRESSGESSDTLWTIPSEGQ